MNLSRISKGITLISAREVGVHPLDRPSPSFLAIFASGENKIGERRQTEKPRGFDALSRVPASMERGYKTKQRRIACSLLASFPSACREISARERDERAGKTELPVRTFLPRRVVYVQREPRDVLELESLHSIRELSLEQHLPRVLSRLSVSLCHT